MSSDQTDNPLTRDDKASDEEAVIEQLRVLVREANSADTPNPQLDLRPVYFYVGLVGLLTLTSIGALVTLVLIAPHVTSWSLGSSSRNYHVLVIAACVGIVLVVLFAMFALRNQVPSRTAEGRPLSDREVDFEVSRLLHDHPR